MVPIICIIDVDVKQAVTYPLQTDFFYIGIKSLLLRLAKCLYVSNANLEE